MILYIYPCTLFIFRHLTLIQLLWESINELKKKKYNVEAICLLAKTKALRQGAKNSICKKKEKKRIAFVETVEGRRMQTAMQAAMLQQN